MKSTYWLRGVLVAALLLTFTVAAFAAMSPLGHGQFTPNAATMFTDAPDAGIAMPSNAKHAVCSVKGFPVRWRDDGTAPTAAVGVYLQPGIYVFDEEQVVLRALKMIDTAEGASEVSCNWYR